MPVDWRLERTNDATIDDDLIDVKVVDAINRFAREATAIFDDPDSTKSGTYDSYTPVELEYRIPALNTGWVRRFAGYVAESDGKDESTEVGILSYDALLRERSLNKGYSSQTVSYILEDIISSSEITPVQWVGGNVTVPNDPTISRVWEGERLDVVLNELASIATSGEPAEWGANKDNEFFFRPRSVNDSPRDFLPGGHWDLELKGSSKDEANRARVYYGKGSNRDAVQVDDGARQSEVQSKLGTADPVIEPVEKNYPQIDNQDAATRKAKDLQRQHGDAQIFEFTTYEALDVDPGDVAHLRNDARGIDTTVRIAQLEYRWKDDETVVRAAENTAGVLDTLVKVADEISRLDARGADTSAVADQVQTLNDVLGFDVSLKVWKTEYDLAQPYTPPDGDNVNFTLDSSYTAPSTSAVDFELEAANEQTDRNLIIDQ